MDWFKRLHGRQVAPGLEVRILRKLPRVIVIGSLIPLGLAVLARLLPAEPGVDPAKHINSVDIFAIATEITFLVAMFTVAIGAVVVHIMKGPAYVADPYELSHADRPEQPNADD